MTKTRWLAAAATVAFVTAVGLSTLYAQERQRTKSGTPPAQTAEAKEVTLSGKLVDLQCYMSGKFVGKSLEACSRACIRRGVPAALETNDGLVVLGMAKGASARLATHAMDAVEVTGKLYEKRGLKYLDVTSVQKLKSLRPKPGEEDAADEPKPEPEEAPEEPDEQPDDPNR
jgi:hypothetical protein